MPRPFKLHDIEQRTPQWLALRAGLLTGSVAGDAASQPNSRSSESPELGEGVKESEKRRTLRNKLAIERICGKSFDQPFSTKWTRDGIAREPLAVYEFEKLRKECVFTAGFISNDALMIGHSPDGFCGDVTDIIDAKCFGWKEHLEALKSDTLDSEIEAQLFHGMWLTGAKRGHCVFFNPEFQPAHRLKVVTLDLKTKATKQAFGVYVSRAQLFLDDVSKTVAYLLTLNQPKKADDGES